MREPYAVSILIEPWARKRSLETELMLARVRERPPSVFGETYRGRGIKRQVNTVNSNQCLVVPQSESGVNRSSRKSVALAAVTAHS